MMHADAELVKDGVHWPPGHRARALDSWPALLDELDAGVDHPGPGLVWRALMWRVLTDAAVAKAQAMGVPQGKFVNLKGAAPIVVDGLVIGAVGVGSGIGEQDLEVAIAAISALPGARSEM